MGKIDDIIKKYEDELKLEGAVKVYGDPYFQGERYRDFLKETRLKRKFLEELVEIKAYYKKKEDDADEWRAIENRAHRETLRLHGVKIGS